ncbi:MAG TPA: hypothetical protein VGC76_09130 [Pyrinomonadaceae bacterium]|jgi:hypothetical protein
MVERVTVILFIALFLMAGVLLTLLPWINIGAFGDWGDNYLLAFVSEKTGLPIIQKAVASGWVRGAITGLGVMNLFLAFWEMAHFKQNVQAFAASAPDKKDSEK